jgi:hypothetical protein
LFLLVRRLVDNTSFLLDTNQDGSNRLGPRAWCRVPASPSRYHLRQLWSTIRHQLPLLPISSSTLPTSPFLQVYSRHCPQSLTLYPLLFPLVAFKIAHETTKMFSCSILRVLCSPFRDSPSKNIQKKHLLDNQRMRDWGRLAENLV